MLSIFGVSIVLYFIKILSGSRKSEIFLWLFIRQISRMRTYHIHVFIDNQFFYKIIPHSNPYRFLS